MLGTRLLKFGSATAALLLCAGAVFAHGNGKPPPADPTQPVNPLKKRVMSGKPLEICDQGAFYIGGVPKVTNYATSSTSTTPGQVIIGQSYVQFQIPTKRRQWPLIMVHGSAHTGGSLDATPDGNEGWLTRSVRANLATFVMDQPGRARSGSDQSVINEAKALIASGNVAGGLAMLPDIGGISPSRRGRPGSATSSRRGRTSSPAR